MKEERLPIMLDETIEYFKKREDRGSFTWEMIIVDDGSKDTTTQIALKVSQTSVLDHNHLQYAKKEGSDKIRVLSLKKNRGKGGAVKRVLFLLHSIH